METPEGAYRLLYDPKKLKKPLALGALGVSPEAEIPGLGTVLEACSPKDPEYGPCDSPVGSDMFLHNAQMNIRRATRKYVQLKKLAIPKDLTPVKEYLLRSGAFYVWLLKTRLEYYQKGKTKILSRKFADVDAGEKCASSIARIDASSSQEEAIRLARVEWHNCVNAAFLQKYGSYPRGLWEKFLKAYEVEERYIK